MHTSLTRILLALFLSVPAAASSAAEFFVSPAGAAIPPFANWAGAATNIQDAIDAASAGDIVWVTNGVYSTGGKAMEGNLTNRVALDKGLTVRSVNGPWWTWILGSTNLANPARGAWLTNGAVLDGFTVTQGRTAPAGDVTNRMSGGGILCVSLDALVVNCVVRSNTAAWIGGGIAGGTVKSSSVVANQVITGPGGAGVAIARLLGSTVVSNQNGLYRCEATNCIVWFNSRPGSSGTENHVMSTLAYSCSAPLPTGPGNINLNPKLRPDNLHLLSGSPCRGAGLPIEGTDIDGQPWRNPPSIGCDEWDEVPAVLGPPRLEMTNNPVGFRITLGADGLEPLHFDWTRDGVPVDETRFVAAHGPVLQSLGLRESDVGVYQAVVTNLFGAVTSAPVRLVARYVDASNAAPSPPYLSWTSAANVIQDAIDAASPNELILVTNGLYASGGKAKAGTLTNRVTIDKAAIVQSVNGPEATIIEGNWDPAGGNGPTAVRCAWLTNGAGLFGFTLRKGATRPVSSGMNDENGGGAWGSSTNSVLGNCQLIQNKAGYSGGGAYRVTLIGCQLIQNRAVGSGVPGGVGAGSGGGAAKANLYNCVLDGNSADQTSGGGAIDCVLVNCGLVGNSTYLYGAAADRCSLLNCTVTGNTSSGYRNDYGGAVANTVLTNCVVWDNRVRLAGAPVNHLSCTMAYSLTQPLPPGPGNLDADPQLIPDGIHLSEGSPCRGKGTGKGIGTDLDGQPWDEAPSIGCDEWHESPIIGAFSTVVSPAFTFRSSAALQFKKAVAGKTPFVCTWFHNGVPVSDDTHHANSTTPDLSVLGLQPEFAGEYFLVVSNTYGSATSLVERVVLNCVDAASREPAPPYATWATAAATIQDAIEAAQPGQIVLVTNGTYSSGGKIMARGLLNRVVIDKPVTVASVNGAPHTIIEGAPDPISTNGPAAVRAVWMTNAAVLAGFTVRNGATLGGSNGDSLGNYGGGIWAAHTNALVWNCIISNNTAGFFGGGAYGAKIRNTFISWNNSRNEGGGASECHLQNCTVYCNVARWRGGGVRLGTVRNSILRGNARGFSLWGSPFEDNYDSANISWSCTSPLPTSGTGNIEQNPMNVDWERHISASSPCRGAGNSEFAGGFDLDGEAWSTPPSMGADEIIDENLKGPLTGTLVCSRTNVVQGGPISFEYRIVGRASRIDWDFGDGTTWTNQYYSAYHIWETPGLYTVTATAYNRDYPEGVSASIQIASLPPQAPTLQVSLTGTNGLDFLLQGEAWAQYSLEYATNLVPPVTWQFLTAKRCYNDGPILLQDTRTNEVRFYRVQAQPF